MYDFVVVGKGLIGSAAARYLASQSSRVLVVGQDEPVDRTRHQGVFASHYDAARVAFRLGMDDVWAQMSIDSISNFENVIKESGVQFHRPCGVLHVSGSEESKYSKNAQSQMERFGLELTYYASNAEIRQQHSLFSFPAGCDGYFEPAPSGVIDPRELIRAQLEIAQAANATVIGEMVTELDESTSSITVTTESGKKFESRQALLTTGAFVNCFKLPPAPLDVRLKTELVVLAEVEEQQLEQFSEMPALLCGGEMSGLKDCYMTPPAQYPDGKWCIKIGGNTDFDQQPETKEHVQRWMQSGADDDVFNLTTDALRELLPDFQSKSIAAIPCIASYSSHGKPYIDQLSSRLFVAAVGNGSAAKCSDLLGRLAVDKMLNTWEYPLPPETFAAALK